MKKNYFIIATLMLLFAIPANAQVSNITDLYGKYNFTATITTTEAGAQYADKFKSECEVVITKNADGYYMGEVQGLMGADFAQPVANIDFSQNTFTVKSNPNWGLWSGYIAVANENGDYPFANSAEDDEYALVYTYNPETKEITLPSFTITSLSWPDGVGTATVLANVKDAKLTLVEAETIEIPEIAGEWTYKVVDGYALNDSTFTTDFTVFLEAADETNKAYNATVTFDGWQPFTLPATFDGSMLTIPFDSLYLDAEQGLRFGVPSPAAEKTGAFTFQYQSSTSMMQYDRIYVRKDSFDIEADTIVGYPIVQRLTWGYITREDPNAVDWAGTYNVKIADVENDVFVYDEEHAANFPTEFSITIAETVSGYNVTNFLGFDVATGLNYGGFAATPSSDGKSLEIKLNGGYGYALLASVEYPLYYQLADANGQSTSLTLTMNEDGSLSLSPFAVMLFNWDEGKNSAIISMQNGVISKEVFDWVGNYAVTAASATNDYPVEFGMVITYYESSDLYMITNFMDTEIGGLNYGGLALTIAADGNSAEVQLDGAYGAALIQSLGEGAYTQLADNGGTTNAITLTVENGVITFPDFKIMNYVFGEGSTAELSQYAGVTAVKAGEETSVSPVAVGVTETVEGIYDLSGRRIEEITAPGIYIVNGKKVLVK